MTGTLSVREASRELEHDHRELHGLVERLARGGDLASMGEALSQLHERLTRHFVAEEKPGGLYDALGVCVPEHRARLGELVDDHFRLAAQVRDAGERARRARGDEADALRAEVARLAAALGDHERREHELVEAALAGDRSATPA